ncbi:protein phosphatase 2C domain-containing protein [bacterium]|nr:protein phosphatase 2C domain-containing protein [bacterium]
MQKVFHIESFATSDVGLVRGNNEDVVKVLDKLHFYALADGMGGHNAGEVAAEKACEYMCHLVESLPLESLTEKDIAILGEKIVSIMEKTNLWVHHLSRQSPHLTGMGTTLCSLLFFGNFMISSHVGDSRIYRLRKGVLKQITKDHLTYKMVGGDGAQTIQRKHALTQAIGTSVKVKPSLLTSEAMEGDLFLMCSDGLSDLVKDEEMEKILKSHISLEAASKFLITLAKSRGGHDNITLLLTKLDLKKT